DPAMKEQGRTRKNIALARELDRRQRGDALTHTFIDFAVYPGQHVSLDWTEQWGPDNANLSGLSFSLFDPIVGIGITYCRIIPQLLNLTVGVKVLISIPTALVRAISNSDTNVLDPLFNGVLV